MHRIPSDDRGSNGSHQPFHTIPETYLCPVVILHPPPPPPFFPSLSSPPLPFQIRPHTTPPPFQIVAATSSFLDRRLHLPPAELPAVHGLPHALLLSPIPFPHREPFSPASPLSLPPATPLLHSIPAIPLPCLRPDPLQPPPRCLLLPLQPLASPPRARRPALWSQELARMVAHRVSSSSLSP